MDEAAVRRLLAACAAGTAPLPPAAAAAALQLLDQQQGGGGPPCGGCGKALTPLPASFVAEAAAAPGCEGACDGCGAAFRVDTANETGHLFCLRCDVAQCAGCRARGVGVRPGKVQWLKERSAEFVQQQLLPMVSDAVARRIGAERAGAVHVAPMVPPAECREFIEVAERYADQNGGWLCVAGAPKQHRASWDRSYSSTDLHVPDIPGGTEFLERAFHQRIAPFLSRVYDLPLAELTIDDSFMVRYDCEDGSQRGVTEHVDGSIVSFLLLLNDPGDFEGGGTRYPCVGEGDAGVVRLGCGECLTALGALRHSGVPVTAGRRYVLVGFCSLRSELVEQTKQRLRHCSAVISEITLATDRVEKLQGRIVRHSKLGGDETE